MSVHEKAVAMETVALESRGREGRESDDGELSRPHPAPPARSDTPSSFREAWQQARTATASTTWGEYECELLTSRKINPILTLRSTGRDECA